MIYFFISSVKNKSLDLKWFLTIWQPFFKISNGRASRFQISFKIQTIWQPTSFWPFEIQTRQISNPYCMTKDLKSLLRYFCCSVTHVMIIIVARNVAEVSMFSESCWMRRSASACGIKMRNFALSFSAHFESKFAHSWFLQNFGDDTKYGYKNLLTVPLQVQNNYSLFKTIPIGKCVHKGALLLSALYEHRVMFITCFEERRG